MKKIDISHEKDLLRNDLSSLCVKGVSFSSNNIIWKLFKNNEHYLNIEYEENNGKIQKKMIDLLISLIDVF